MIDWAIFAAALAATALQPANIDTPEPHQDVSGVGDRSDADDRVVIDILVRPPERSPPSEAEIRACEDEIDAATVTGEIIVCRKIGDKSENYYSGSRENARARYAEETAFAGDIVAPDVAGAGIFRGPATIGGLCFIPPCPKEPALIIDIEALPEPPEGSDADLISRGLPHLNQDEGLSEDELRRARSALGIPVDE